MGDKLCTATIETQLRLLLKQGCVCVCVCVVCVCVCVCVCVLCVCVCVCGYLRMQVGARSCELMFIRIRYTSAMWAAASTACARIKQILRDTC